VGGETGVARTRIGPGATGQVELRGTPWTAQNTGEATIEPGDRVSVERAESLVLKVRKES
jgi:membrane protein implicated in regulation of membrane protease activity